MATGNRARPLPKFGEWDATNPGSAEGFTVIFNKARDDKKTMKTAAAGPESIVSPPRNEEPPKNNNNHHHNHHTRHSQTPRSKKKWLCFR
ncbi:RIN4 pathogenic type III effector avirulence factor Avr cleavage site [Arabidopsis thaliana x Arabidopsis arenosa]|uniref:RIN4 pathogenic type III effector avirulence factor Avr cleavage site domain-containing protein n=2 Tax=Arabidopsis TaxID=3701 RepID=A0A178V854_ARATH|nr:RIN4 pathogenic type III effector avirulence factor Avr cleavage site [Arabidopsis thaliana x Arabidopsis arenosa]OAP01898.1 hypothetical protein AXX17_AT3G42570 [Arabidopsis thaliana]